MNDMVLIQIIGFGMLLLLLGAFTYQIINYNIPHMDDRPHFKYCQEGLTYRGYSEINFCKGKPFVCNENECYNINMTIRQK